MPRFVDVTDPSVARDVLGVGTFSVTDYGAQGDGVADDTTAVQAAIDAADTAAQAIDSNLRRDATVYFPPGNYLVSNITVPTCVTLVGNTATLQAISGTTGYLVTFTDGYYGGMRTLRLQGANLTDNLGAVQTSDERRHILIERNIIENFRGRAVYLQGNNPRVKGNYMAGLLGDQTALATYTGVLHLASTANDCVIADNEINAGRWHESPEYLTEPTAAHDMFVCAVAVITAGFGMFRNNIAENAETGFYFNTPQQIHMSGNRSEFNWGHGYWFVGSGSGRIEGCLSLENSKVGTGEWDGFHFGDGDVADQPKYQITNCVSKSNVGIFGSYVQHRYGFYDIGVNNNNFNTFVSIRSEGDVAELAQRASTPVSCGATYSVPNAHSALPMSGATPSVFNRTWFRCSGSTTITAFIGAARGQMFHVLGNGSVTVENNSDIVLLSGANTALANGKWYTFLSHDGQIKQIDLSGNLTATATLNFGSVSAQSYADLTVTVNGAVSGDAVSLGVTAGAIAAGIAYTAWVSAADTVTVRAHNYTGGAVDPGSGNFKIVIPR